MSVQENLPTHLTMPPKGPLRKIALWGVNHLLGLQHLKLPPDFPLHQRLAVLQKGIEPDIRHLCSQYVSKGMTVIDVGANAGLITRHFCRLVGANGKVYSFEPDPLVFRFLEFNTRLFSNKELIQSAVSDNNEPMQLHLNSCSSLGNSLFNKNRSAESVTVSCTSLDEFLTRRGEPTVDVIKIDTEGAELSVLRGMRQTIARLPALKIIIEYCPQNLKGAGIEPRAVLDELRSHQFCLQIIQNDGSLKKIDGDDVSAGDFNPNGYVNLFCAR
ncbi:MAG TPA: FkbM family methyltransferase [Verrucomicrobiae bacterium]|jgi:FkbM family methyltransferase